MSEISSEELIRLHSAGATVRHEGPFSDLEVPCSRDKFDKAFYYKWVVPFYMAFMDEVDELRAVLVALSENGQA